MDEIIEQIAATNGISAQVARNATGVVINFLKREGPADAINSLMDALPGSHELAAEAKSSSGGFMGILGDLTGAGLRMGDIQGFITALVSQVRAKAGPEKVDAVMAAIPGLASLV